MAGAAPDTGYTLFSVLLARNFRLPHTTQYFEMLGNRALQRRLNGIDNAPWQPKALPGADDPMSFDWELYHLAEDFTQADNLVEQNPDKLRELQDPFWAEAARDNVLPLVALFAERVDPSIRPRLTRGEIGPTHS